MKKREDNTPDVKPASSPVDNNNNNNSDSFTLVLSPEAAPASNAVASAPSAALTPVKNPLDDCLFLNESVFLISKAKYDAHKAELDQSQSIVLETELPIQGQTIKICRLKTPRQIQHWASHLVLPTYPAITITYPMLPTNSVIPPTDPVLPAYPAIPSVGELQNIVQKIQGGAQTTARGGFLISQYNEGGRSPKSLAIGFEIGSQRFLFSDEDVRLIHKKMTDDVYASEKHKIQEYGGRMGTLDAAIDDGSFGKWLNGLCDLEHAMSLMPNELGYQNRPPLLESVYHQTLATRDNFNWNQDFIANGDEWSPLQVQASKNHYYICAWLIAHGQNLYFREPKGHTAFAIAAASDAVNTMKMLLAWGADPGAVSDDKTTALHLAATLGYVSVVTNLVSIDGVSLNAVNDHKMTPLLLAVQNRHTDVVEGLLKGAIRKPSGKQLILDMLASKTNSRRTALHYAASLGNVDIVKLLLKYKANALSVDEKDDLFKLSANDFSLLQLAAQGGHLDVAQWIWSQIIERPNVNVPAYLNHQNEFGYTALYSAAFNAHATVVGFLLDQNADPFLDSKDGWTVIMLLARAGDNTRLQRVLNLIPNAELRAQRINSLTLEKWTAMHSAASLGHASTVKILMANGGDILQKDVRSWTPLACAVQQGHVGVVKVILEELRKNNALQNARKVHDDLKVSLLHLAAASKNCQDPEMMTVLLQYGFDATPRVQFALPEKPPTTPASLLIRPKSPAELAIESGKSQAFVKASFLFNDLQLIANSEKVKEWLTKNPSLATAVNHRGENALHIAFRNGHLQTAEVVMEELIKQSKLIEALASNGYDKNVGMTPLHEAIESVIDGVAEQAINMVSEMLLEYSGQELFEEPWKKVPPKPLTLFNLLKSVDRRGRSLLYAAVEKDKLEAVTLLTNVKADTEWMAGASKLTPLMLATQKGNKRMVELLVEQGQANPAFTNIHGKSAMSIAQEAGNQELVDYFEKRKKTTPTIAPRALMLQSEVRRPGGPRR